MMSGGRVTAEGRAMMEQLMQSGKIAEVLTGMMTMVRNMGGGDSMTGMVRMMKMGSIQRASSGRRRSASGTGRVPNPGRSSRSW